MICLPNVKGHWLFESWFCSGYNHRVSFLFEFESLSIEKKRKPSGTRVAFHRADMKINLPLNLQKSVMHLCLPFWQVPWCLWFSELWYQMGLGLQGGCWDQSTTSKHQPLFLCDKVFLSGLSTRPSWDHDNVRHFVYPVKFPNQKKTLFVL